MVLRFEYVAKVATFDGIVTYKATNIRQLAKLLNTSRSSVQYILNDEPNCVLKRFVKIDKKQINETASKSC